MARKAFLVGLNRYQDPRNNLKGCVNDVLLMAKTLREQYRFDGPSDVKLLTGERATTANIRKGLERLVRKLPVRRFGIALTKTNAVPIAGGALREAEWKTTYRKLIAATGAELADHNCDQTPQLEGPRKTLSSMVFP